MIEHQKYYPDLKPNSSENHRIDEAHNLSLKLITLLRQESPSSLIAGLPVYHLRRLANFVQSDPSWILNNIGVSEEEFISLCKRFDSDIIVKSAAELENEQDKFRQERLTEVIAAAIVRGSLMEDNSINVIGDRWQSSIMLKVEQYNSGERIFDGLRVEDLFSQQRANSQTKKLAAEQGFEPQ